MSRLMRILSGLKKTAVPTPSLFDEPKADLEPVASSKSDRPVSLHVTLWPTFPHFTTFARANPLVQGIRLNSAMTTDTDLDEPFLHAVKAAGTPLWFDIKGMQLRIKEVVSDHRKLNLEFILNRPVTNVRTPCPVWFKGGEDCGELLEIRNGTHFVFRGGPKNEVRVGESIHLRQDDAVVGGPTLLPHEIHKITVAKKMGFTRWYLSYVYSQNQVDAFREQIGPDADLVLKIENKAGLEYVAREYEPRPNTQLAAARGDLFVELEWPHQILDACKLIVEKDPDAVVGSRMLLSLVNNNLPNCADINELAWLYDAGFRNFLLCDELCLQDTMLRNAVAVFDTFRKEYCKDN